MSTTIASHTTMRGFMVSVLILIGAFLSPVAAGEADVTAASIEKAASGTFLVSATIRHADTGWEHYADAFEVLTPDGVVLKTRVLLHPHVEEQPFTRRLSGVEIPSSIRTVTIRAKDSVHEYGGATVTLDVPH